nr:MAG TPA: hypothetical protein [Caudoviricetes sp.]
MGRYGPYCGRESPGVRLPRPARVPKREPEGKRREKENENTSTDHHRDH